MTLNIFVVVNKNGAVRMFTDEPKRNNETGYWESKNPYVNSVLYKDFSNLCTKANLTWESEPNQFTIEFKNKTKGK